MITINKLVVNIGHTDHDLPLVYLKVTNFFSLYLSRIYTISTMDQGLHCIIQRHTYGSPKLMIIIDFENRNGTFGITCSSSEYLTDVSSEMDSNNILKDLDKLPISGRLH